MIDNPLYNPGDYFTNQTYAAARESNWIAFGEIINLTSDGDYQQALIQRYDVLVFNTSGWIAKGCIPISMNFSGNGVGEYAQYKSGDAVIISCLYNGMDNVVILGAVSLPGDLEELLGKDTKVSKLRTLQGNNSYAPQPLLSPDRSQNPSANKITISSTQMDKDSYKSQDLIKNSQDRIELAQNLPLPNGIEIDTGLGDKGSYFRGIEYKYVNGSYYHIVVADKENQCAKATKVAKVALDTANKSKSLGLPRNSNSLITAAYRATQYQKMHDLALEAAKQCNTKALVAKQSLEANKATNNTTSGLKVSSDYKPNEAKLSVNNSNVRIDLTDKQVIDFISFSQWNNQLEEKDNQSAIRAMYLKYGLLDPTSSINITPITQQLKDKILGDPTYKTYKDNLNK